MTDMSSYPYDSVKDSLPDLSGVRKLRGQNVKEIRYNGQAGTDGEDLHVRVYAVYESGVTVHVWYLIEDLPYLVRDGK